VVRKGVAKDASLTQPCHHVSSTRNIFSSDSPYPCLRVFVCRLLVGVFNPLLGLVCMFVLPLEQIYAQNSSLLAAMGKVVGGTSFSNFICVDAVLVLCGAVLTSYVGITGLFRRLAQDKVLPGFLLNTNIRGANHWIIFVFFILTSSLFLAIFDPNDPTAINIFGSVYALAFLSVMFCFACACIALKVQRPFMARLVVTEWWQIYVCMACVAVGMAGKFARFYATEIYEINAAYTDISSLCFYYTLIIQRICITSTTRQSVV